MQRINFDCVFAAADAGTRFLVVSKASNDWDYMTTGAIYFRTHRESGLKSVAVDTVIYMDPPTDRVRTLCACRLRTSRNPVIIHNY